MTNIRHGRVAAAIALLVCFFLAPALKSQVPAAWGELQPGPYVPGFKTIERYDYSRTFRAKTTYFGTPIPD